MIFATALGNPSPPHVENGFLRDSCEGFRKRHMRLLGYEIDALSRIMGKQGRVREAGINHYTTITFF